MSGWFVYQRDVFPPAMDPDTLGAKLVPEYDHQRNLIYIDSDGPEHSGLRRIQSRWGVDPDIVQMDIVLYREWPDTHHQHSPLHTSGNVRPPMHTSTRAPSMSSSLETLVWTPSKEYMCFTNHHNGFQLENRTSGWCVNVARDPHTQTQHATLLAAAPTTDNTHPDPAYTRMVGVVVGIRVHTLTLVAPGSSSWFARQVTAQTTSLVDTHTTTHREPRVPLYSKPPSDTYLTFSTASSSGTKATSRTSTAPLGGIAYRRKSNRSRVANICAHPGFGPSATTTTAATVATLPVTQQTAHRVAHQMAQQQHTTTVSLPSPSPSPSPSV